MNKYLFSVIIAAIASICAYGMPDGWSVSGDSLRIRSNFNVTALYEALNTVPVNELNYSEPK